MIVHTVTVGFYLMECISSLVWFITRSKAVVKDDQISKRHWKTLIGYVL